MARNWKKGALHTHTLWSDGRNLPEMVLKTYRDRGFDFVCLSDHNIFPERENFFLPVAREEGPWPPMASRAVTRSSPHTLFRKARSSPSKCPADARRP